MARGKKYVSSKVTILAKEEQPFSVPENWFWTDIDSINQYSGSPVDPMKQPDTVFELYSVPSSADDYPEILAGSEIGSSKQSVIKNDILLCKINPRINRVWKVSQHTDNELMASSEWIVVRNSVINSDYLMFCFRTQFFREFMLSNVSGVGGSLMRAQPKYVKKYPVPIAPIDEQHRIVSRIESLFAKLDKAKEKAQAVVDGFELRKSAILHKAFTGELTERWRKEHGVGLDSWKDTTLSEIVSGFKYGTSEKSTYNNKGMPVLRIPNVGTGTLSFEDMKYLAHNDIDEANQVHENDLLIIRSNGSRDLVGKCAIVPALSRKFAYASFLIRIKPSERILPDYLAFYLNSTDARTQMFKKAKSSAGIHNINSQELGSITINVPTIYEQSAIIAVLNNLLAKEQQAKEAAEAVLSQIDTMKKAILACAFRGKLGTNDPAEEWAVELLRTYLPK